jgi:hypothetical protein
MFFKSRVFVLIFLVSTGFNTNVFAISKMSEKELKNKTAQAGISVAVKDAVFYNHESSVKFIDAESDPLAVPGFIEFKNIKSLTTINTGHNIDPDSTNYMGHIYIDIASPEENTTGYNSPYASIVCDDFQTTSFIKVEEINFNGKSIGSLDVVGANFPKWNMFFGAHDCGIDFELGFQFHTTSFKYNYGPEADNTYLGFDNLLMAKEFSGDLVDPSTWQATGKFKIGDFENNNPATIDIGTREFNGQTDAIISISAPMQGSIRMENIHMGNSDFGPAAIDGINVHRLSIELPGRDLGNI